VCVCVCVCLCVCVCVCAAPFLHTHMQNLAMKTAEKHHAHIIVANDPDVDRLALAEWQSE